MTSVLVDSNILLDILTGDPVWSEPSARSLASLADRSRLVINPIIYAEISVRYSRREDLDQALPETLRRESIPYSAAFLAAKAYREYRRRGGTRLSPLPDFYIGAHAAIAGHSLLTRDPSGYASYFPRLAIIAPD